MNNMQNYRMVVMAVLFLLPTILLAQNESPNAITTAVPFLQIAPDSRSGSMGDAGAAIDPDANAVHWNAAKLAFVKKDMGFNISYTPWLRNLTSDMSLAYLGFYKRINDKQTMGASMRYFSLGQIIFSTSNGSYAGDGYPHELAFDVSYALQLAENLSGGIAMRYIYSNLAAGAFVGSSEVRPAHAGAGDISIFYGKDIDLGANKGTLGLGGNISNIGNKVSYTAASRNFLPTNLRLGSALGFFIDDYNKITFAFDVNKLLVPSPGVIKQNELTGEQQTFGVTEDISVPTAIFGSFTDAPGVIKWDDGSGQWLQESGSVLREELHEIMYSFGAEYMYANQLALRAGYFHEHANKGNRKYFTFGLGLKLNVFGLDFSYLLPTNSYNHPLTNTLRFTLSFDLDAFKKQNKAAE